MFALIAAAELRSPRIQRFADYWEKKRAGRRVPLRQDIDPLELKEMLPLLMVVEIEAHPFRVLYRLAGTMVVEMNGLELTGRYLDDLSDVEASYVAQLLAAYRLAWENQEPVFGTYDWPTKSNERYRVEFAIFPVTQTGTPGQCIALEDWETSNPGEAPSEMPLPFSRKRK
ncbi:MAG: PAS domain-containing protein [Dongiaceae bacterium]